MAANVDHYIGRGATGPSLEVTIGGGTIPLDGATATFEYRREDALSVITRPAVVVDPATNKLRWDPDASDTTRACRLLGRFRVLRIDLAVIFFPDDRDIIVEVTEP